MFVRGLGAMVGILLIASQMGLPGSPGVCNSELAGKDNTMECARGLWYLWVVVAPCMSFMIALTAWRFPIYGQR